MILLVDTHVLLWALLDPTRLSPRAAAALADRQNELLVSAVSAWEIAVKHSLGKINLPGPPEVWVPAAVAALGGTWLAISPADALSVAALPMLHRDPFDRVLVAQALRGRILVTADARMRAYGVKTLW